MATFFDRLVGTEGDRIPIHAFSGALSELQQGYLTGAEVVAMFSLTSAQTTDALVLRDLLQAAPDHVRFLRVFKDWLYLGEVGADARYLSATQLVQRLRDEVVAQGGVLP